MNVALYWIFAVLGLWACVPADGWAQSEITPESLQKQSDRILQAKLAISAEKTKWEEQKALFTKLIEVREKEIAKIDEFTESARGRIETVTQKRAELSTERQDRRAWRAELLERVEALEQELRLVLPRFPQPVINQAEQAVARLKADPVEGEEDAALQDRFRDVLTILAAARDFDGKLSVETEVREVEGQRYQVDVLYMGLDQAWYVDRSGKVAGLGRPTDQGWIWEERPSLSAPIREAIAVQTREAPPAMVSLPFSEGVGGERAGK